MKTTETSPALAIVGGIALDETSRLVLARVAELAAGREATVHLCYACGDLSTDADTTEKLLERHEADLQSWAAKTLIGHPLAAQSRVHVAVGEPADALATLAQDVGASFIVVGTHERSRFERLVKGSVARKLIDEAPCSVIVAMPRTTSGGPLRPTPADSDTATQVSPPSEATGAAVIRKRVNIRQPAQSTVGVGGAPLQV